jgi:hypothetical protein
VTATLRVSRKTGFGIELRGGPFDIILDGENVGTLDHEQATDVPVERGHHTLRMRKGRYKSHERAFDAEEGQVVTFTCHGDKVWPTWLMSFVKPDLAIALDQN